MHRIVVSAGIGIVAAGMFALPAMSASAATSAPVSTSASGISGSRECDMLISDVYRLEDDNVRLEGQLVKAESGGNRSGAWYITEEINDNKDFIDWDIKEEGEFHCSSLPGNNGVLRADLNPQPLPPGVRRA